MILLRTPVVYKVVKNSVVSVLDGTTCVFRLIDVIVSDSFLRAKP